MDKTLQRDKHLRSPNFVRNQLRSSCRGDSTSIRTDLDSGKVKRPRSNSISRNAQDTVQTPDAKHPMWSWYYGESGQPASSINVLGMQSLNFIQENDDDDVIILAMLMIGSKTLLNQQLAAVDTAPETPLTPAPLT